MYGTWKNSYLEEFTCDQNMAILVSLSLSGEGDILATVKDVRFTALEIKKSSFEPQSSNNPCSGNYHIWIMSQKYQIQCKQTLAAVVSLVSSLKLDKGVLELCLVISLSQHASIPLPLAASARFRIRNLCQPPGSHTVYGLRRNYRPPFVEKVSLQYHLLKSDPFHKQSAKRET